MKLAHFTQCLGAFEDIRAAFNAQWNDVVSDYSLTLHQDFIEDSEK